MERDKYEEAIRFMERMASMERDTAAAAITAFLREESTNRADWYDIAIAALREKQQLEKEKADA